MVATGNETWFNETWNRVQGGARKLLLTTEDSYSQIDTTTTTDPWLNFFTTDLNVPKYRKKACVFGFVGIPLVEALSASSLSPQIPNRMSQ